MGLNDYSDYGSGSSSETFSPWGSQETWLPLRNLIQETEKMNREKSASFSDVTAKRSIDAVLQEFRMNGSDSPYDPDEDALNRRTDTIMTESGNSMEYSNKIVIKVDVHHRHCCQTSTSIPNVNAIHPKTAAERTQECRTRKKSQTQLANANSQIQRKRPKSAAERTRECRARKKAVNDNFQMQRKCLKSTADRTRERRARKKTTSDNSQMQRKRPKTAAERTRECRARKKAASDTSQIQRKRPKSAAERAREYRARKKAKILSAGLMGLGPSSVYLRQKSWPAPERSPVINLPQPLPSPATSSDTVSSTSSPTLHVEQTEMLTAEQLHVLSSLPRAVLKYLLRGLQMHRERGTSTQDETADIRGCAFCRSNGERAAWYRGHVLRAAGRVRCPVLRALVCRRCGARGDTAHTLKYCPLATPDEREKSAAMMRSIRTASGRRRAQQLAPSNNATEYYVRFGETTPSVIQDGNVYNKYEHAPLDPIWAALEKKLML